MKQYGEETEILLHGLQTFQELYLHDLQLRAATRLFLVVAGIQFLDFAEGIALRGTAHHAHGILRGDRTVLQRYMYEAQCLGSPATPNLFAVSQYGDRIRDGTEVLHFHADLVDSRGLCQGVGNPSRVLLGGAFPGRILVGVEAQRRVAAACLGIDDGYLTTGGCKRWSRWRFALAKTAG